MTYLQSSGTGLLLRGLGDNFTIGNTKFRYLGADSQVRTTSDDEVLILKHAPFLAVYDRILSAPRTNNVLEFGIAEGGSIIYFALAFPHLKFVGIDLRSENAAVLRHIDRLGLADRIKLYYKTDQSDQDKVSHIIEDNFGSESIGVVIDDASHFYKPSRRTFEIAFPYVAPGGHYCLEDWGWAHEEEYQNQKWADHPALTNLVFELTALVCSRNDIVESIEVLPVVTLVKRGVLPARRDPFELDKLLRLRGKRIDLI
jgi:hypothetical protein